MPALPGRLSGTTFHTSLPLALLIVVSYDIPNDRRRTRLAHALKDLGRLLEVLGRAKRTEDPGVYAL